LAVPRREAQQAVVDCGAVASRGVTRHTDVLVTGFQDLTKLARGESKSAKLRRAEDLIAAGRDVEIIGESEFVLLLGVST
jgi:DNA polymerase-3 subunit epsilon